MSQRLRAFFASLLCSAALCVGLCFCVITSFSVPVDVSVFLPGCILAALCASALFMLRRAGLVLAAVLVLLLAAGIYFRQIVLQSFAALYAPICEQFLLAIPALPLPDVEAGERSATKALLLIAGLYALLCSWTVQRAKSALALLLTAVPVFALCFIILQTPPAPWACVLVVGVLALILLTQQLRARQAGAAHHLLFYLAAPLAALMTLLAVLFPADGYERAAWSNALQSAVTQATDKLTHFRFDVSGGQLQVPSAFAPGTLGSYLWDSSVSGVDLSRLSPQRRLGRTVMHILTDEDERLYLRGVSMAVYEDDRWQALEASAYDAAGQCQTALLAADLPQSASSASAGVMQIRTDLKSGILYTPYYPSRLPQSAQTHYDVYIDNPSQLTEYTIGYQPQRDTRPDAQYEAFVHTVYTQVPQTTRQALSQFLPQFDTPLALSDSSVVRIERSMQVAQYVMQSARYDRNTPTMPAGEDFAAWFLLESETGYCVHFATATTLLLRCLDIPARYVTGYCVTPRAGEWTAVTSDDAHAWVEVYLDGVGWYRLETTPAAEAQPQPQPEQSAQNATETSGQIEPEAKSDEKITQKMDENEAKMEQKHTVLHVFHAVFSWIWPALIVIFALFSWRILVFSLRKAAFHNKNLTRRTIICFHHAQFFSHFSRRPIPQSLLELAQKARFSQHKLTAQEIAPLLAFCEAQTGQLLAETSIWKRFLYRVIFALG